MRNIRIQLVQSKTSVNETIENVILDLKSRFDEGNRNNLSYHAKINKNDLKTEIENTFNCSVRGGCLQGVYGANTGKYDEGFTLWVSPEEFPERFIDEDGDEVVNTYRMLQDMGEELEITDNLDDFIDLFELKEVAHDNTYNHEGRYEGEPVHLSTIDFKWFQLNDCYLVTAEFHYGGDVRGNYASPVYFKFDSEEDIYSCFWPSPYLKEEA